MITSVALDLSPTPSAFNFYPQLGKTVIALSLSKQCTDTDFHMLITAPPSTLRDPLDRHGTVYHL